MQAILKKCVQLEERVGASYRELAVSPGIGDELQALWQAMSDDEECNAHRIRLVADRLEMAGVHELHLDAAELQALLDRAGEILQDVQEQTLSTKEAIYASVELEDGFIKAHLADGAVESHPDLQTLFRSLAEEDRKHTAALKAYVDRMHDGAGLEFSDPGKEA